MKVTFAGATDVGKVRDHNEDSFAIVADQNLVLVCDGMGGHAAGEVASSLSVETITKIIKDQDMALFDQAIFPYPETITAPGKLLVGAIAVANQRIIDRAKASPNHLGMGTTVIACHFDNGIVSICHVGDSRAYLIRDKSIKRVTIDHSWVSEVMEKHNLTEEESENLVNKNVITRALGTKPNIRTDISQIRTLEGDLFLLCSDGLSNMVSDTQILKAATTFGDDLEGLVKELIASANQAGGLDNITLCAAKVAQQDGVVEFDEIRRVTVDWGDEALIKAIREIIVGKFDAEATQPHFDADDTVGFRTPGGKKKRIISRIIVYLLIAVVIFALTYWFLQSM